MKDMTWQFTGGTERPIITIEDVQNFSLVFGNANIEVAFQLVKLAMVFEQLIIPSTEGMRKLVLSHTAPVDLWALQKDTHSEEFLWLCYARTSASVSLGTMCFSLRQWGSLQVDMPVSPSGLWSFPSRRPLAYFGPDSLTGSTNLSFQGHWSGQFHLIQETQLSEGPIQMCSFLNRTSLHEVS